MVFSIRLTDEERALAESYAKMHSYSLAEAFKRALFEKIEEWRYRIGDYRMICQIEDSKLIILALTIGHRSNIYTV